MLTYHLPFPSSSSLVMRNDLVSWNAMCQRWGSFFGFGYHRSQMYIKHGLTLTSFHDEIGYAAAVNQIEINEYGETLWIRCNLAEVREKYATQAR